jgi:putative redox protein
VLLDLGGPLTDEQRDRLLEIAQRCPVHRTLVGQKQIVTQLKPEEPHADPASRSESATQAGRA